MNTFDFSQFPLLQSDRLILKRATESDIESILAILSEKDVVRYTGLEPYETLADAKTELDWYERLIQEKTGIRWAIFLKGEERMIGSCGYKNYAAAHARAEIGYELNKSFWGRGIMSEALQAVVHFGFTSMNLHRIEAEVDTRNAASSHLLRKFGFVDEGILRDCEKEGDNYISLLSMSLLSNEYHS
ncbi:GNAT family N-acetyltransferase [Falsibacillus pallidus]|uniref:Ribosomal-protein-alanine N-acetyltransferase n=1 Tax=Falsibacillus pallidus TaxID=493781 RepID=A0A370G3Z7_9BACI|nr:GNAT family N-acetyltransferase [Falsibacillus pallidus]RDI38508.1 ribosomal-protein-alanine N-acetyltransferase [Falsibacillus pallidus]